MHTKQCSKCSTAKPYNILPKRTADRIPKTYYYYNGELRWWDGKQLRNKENDKKYYEANKEYKKEYVKKYQAANKEKIGEQRKKYRAANKEYYKKYNKKYQAANKEKLREQKKKYNAAPENKERRNKRRRNRYKNDDKYRLTRILRRRFSTALKSQNTKKNTHVLQLTSCTMDFLRDYLSQQFEKGMTWNNHGDWHIDHRKPCASFDLTKEEEQRKCFHYTNLKPLWGSENIQKRDTFNEATFEYTWVEHKGWEKKK